MLAVSKANLIQRYIINTKALYVGGVKGKSNTKYNVGGVKGKSKGLIYNVGGVKGKSNTKALYIMLAVSKANLIQRPYI